MKAEKIQCPWCKCRPNNDEKLARHIMASHKFEKVGDRSMAGMGVYPLHCWCAWTWRRSSRFAAQDLVAHWDQMGGLHAHILELSLGVADD